MSTTIRYVAIGDSFTEGVGDERPDGIPRGWADPTSSIPNGAKVEAKGDALVAAIAEMVGEHDLKYTDNWSDPELPSRQYWSADRLHLGPVGHMRVAHNVLTSLGFETPSYWVTTAYPIPKPTRREELQYTVDHVLPWIGRRLTGRSSGDGRTGKYFDWVEIHPRTR